MGDVTYNYYSGTDTVIYNFTSYGFTITTTALEKDKIGNVTKSTVVSNALPNHAICIYKYEYYQ